MELTVCRKEAELFKVLGVGSRIRIIDLLKQKGPLYVNEMARTLGISASALSQHLKILRHAGLVQNQRKGFWIAYDVDPVALEQCRKVISEVCQCGCEESCRVTDLAGCGENSPGEGELATLTKREKELEEELQKVRIRLEKVKEET